MDALGLLLAANRFWYFIPLDPIALLRAHAHLGLVGFFITLLQGVGFQLIPMFTLGEVRDWRLANRGLWLTQGSLLLLAPALTWQVTSLAIICASTLTAGLLCSAIGLKQALATRKKRAFGHGTRAFLRGGVGLCVAALAGLGLVASGGSNPGGYSANVYAVLVVVGGLLPCIAGMMCKIVPFLTWMRAYGPRVGRGPTPSATALSHPTVEPAGLVLQLAAVIPLLVGAWTLDERWLVAGAATLGLGVTLFVANMVWVLRHLWIRPPAFLNHPRA